MVEQRDRNPNHVNIFDTTLRDGFQSPGVNVGPEGRLAVAKILARMNVDVIEAGFPISSQGNFESVHEIARTVHGPVIAGLSRANLNDIDRNWAAIEPAKDKGGARIHTFIATSEIHMIAGGMTPEQVIDSTRKAIRHARQYTPDVEFSAEDATRSDFDFMMLVFNEAIDAGATTINIPDTTGFIGPRKYAQLIARTKRQIDQRFGKGLVVVSAHCHDDRGLAVANTLEAIMAGARQVEVSINGIGERVGNAAFEEIIANLDAFPNDFMVDGVPLSTQVDPSHIFEASRLVEEITGMTVAPNKTVVGKNAFSHESGIHQAKIMKNRKTYEVLDSKTFGKRESELVIGAESGHTAIVGRATELGFKISDGDRSELTQEIKEYANSTRRAVTDIELEKIIAEFTGEKLNDRIQLVHADIHGSEQESSAEITISINGVEQTLRAVGKGPIGAAVQAIKNATGSEADITDFSSKSIGEGSQAKGSVYLTVQNGMKITSYAEGESVDIAAVNAYIAALNMIDRTKQRVQEPKTPNKVDLFIPTTDKFLAKRDE